MRTPVEVSSMRRSAVSNGSGRQVVETQMDGADSTVETTWLEAGYVSRSTVTDAL
jgi:hypothetical protein